MPGLTRAAVEAAIKEYDTKGRQSFLNEYGFKGARDYFLVVDGKNYDSKAIVAVAHKFMEAGRPLTHDELVGGKNDAAKKLIELGFQVTTPGENPDWTWDEHVLALDLYFQLKGTAFSKIHPRISELSAFLRNKGRTSSPAATGKFRNVNGVNMKLMNFRRLDPDMEATGRVGLTKGSRGEVGVWDCYADDRAGLAAAVRIIRSGTSPGISAPEQDQDDGSAEGSIVIRLHKARERDGSLARRKKAAVLAANGKLACEVCNMTFAERYGEHGQDFIEVHHIDPIALSQPERRTTLGDLSCVCSNCHRMLHRNGLREISWLKQLLRLP